MTNLVKAGGAEYIGTNCRSRPQSACLDALSRADHYISATRIRNCFEQSGFLGGKMKIRYALFMGFCAAFVTDSAMAQNNMNCRRPQDPSAPLSPVTRGDLDQYRDQIEDYRRALDSWKQCKSDWYNGTNRQHLGFGDRNFGLHVREFERNDQDYVDSSMDLAESRLRRLRDDVERREADEMREAAARDAAIEARNLALNASKGGKSAGKGGKGSGGMCRTSLSYLAGQLPRYSDPMLDQARSAVLQTNLTSALGAAMSQGYTPSSAAAAALSQARSAEQSLPQAAACIRGAAANPAGTISQLQTGTFSFSDRSITSDCARGYILAYYSVIANRESAVGMACLARSK